MELEVLTYHAVKSHSMICGTRAQQQRVATESDVRCGCLDKLDRCNAIDSIFAINLCEFGLDEQWLTLHFQ